MGIRHQLSSAAGRPSKLHGHLRRLRHVHIHRKLINSNPQFYEHIITDPKQQTLRYRQRHEVQYGEDGLPEARTRILPTKVIRVLSFAPDLENPAVDETIENRAERGEGVAAEVPQVNNMRSDLIQLIAMLEGEPDLADLPVTVDQEVADDLGLEEWLEEDEWEDESDNEIENDYEEESEASLEG